MPPFIFMIINPISSYKNEKDWRLLMNAEKLNISRMTQQDVFSTEQIESVSVMDIDLEIMKNYLRIDFDDEDNDRMLSILLASGKSFVQNYLNWKFTDVDEVPLEITIALLAIVEHWYKNRGVMSEDATTKELPYVFAGILNMHRNINLSFVPEGGALNGSIWTTQ